MSVRAAHWRVDHVAIVVADLEAAVSLYTQTFGMPLLYRETIAGQGVEAVGIAAGDSAIELLRPLDETSAIARFRADADTKLHHVAYRVSHIEAELARLSAAGVRLIDVVPRRGANGNVVAFLHPKSTAGVLTELCERRL
ncbi:MAG: methylmalonyl-CoA epimerase [Candidatus Eremiobacteraeota bacterium]|nr:methylmalonyl-CoA epimerase [Candidatus Eremiobacteraeota bacterium]